MQISMSPPKFGMAVTREGFFHQTTKPDVLKSTQLEAARKILAADEFMRQIYSVVVNTKDLSEVVKGAKRRVKLLTENGIPADVVILPVGDVKRFADATAELRLPQAFTPELQDTLKDMDVSQFVVYVLDGPHKDAHDALVARREAEKASAEKLSNLTGTKADFTAIERTYLEDAKKICES